jgi:hypothetical protein
MSQLKVEVGYLTAIAVAVIEGTTCAMVDCADYDAYKRLPEVVSYHGVKMGKTGWNSDTNRAHYQSNATILQVAPKGDKSPHRKYMLP